MIIIRRENIELTPADVDYYNPLSGTYPNVLMYTYKCKGISSYHKFLIEGDLSKSQLKSHDAEVRIKTKRKHGVSFVVIVNK